MNGVGFEPTAAVFEPKKQVRALDRAATVTETHETNDTQKLVASMCVISNKTCRFPTKLSRYKVTAHTSYSCRSG
jgi:hypothetical protein